MLNKKNLDLITLDKFKNYLQLNNWVQNINFPNKNLLVFNKIYDDIEFDIVIPSKETFKDFQARLYDSISILADLEEVDENRIINEILYKKPIIKDTLSIRLISDNTESGTISLDTAYNAIYGIKRLITSSILNEHNPQPYKKQCSKKDISDDLLNYTLGQTDVGSYVFNIEIENSDEQVVVNHDTSLATTSKERKVISRILNGINDITNINTPNEIPYLLDSEYKTGLNANMCDALLSFNDNDYNLKLEASIKWGSNTYIPPHVPEKALLQPKHFFTLAEIASEYKHEETELLEITGDIISLFHEKDEKIITIRAKYNNKKRKFKAIMDDEDYLIACNAHAEEKQISLTGELRKKGRFTYIQNYSNLIIIDN
ncbi:hypothetical protein L0P85_06885 [Terrisporobacter glycolicus]|nr:hypothetical protein L0P85_06885 [Terrisporobacter glycolicus]